MSSYQQDLWPKAYVARLYVCLNYCKLDISVEDIPPGGSTDYIYFKGQGHLHLKYIPFYWYKYLRNALREFLKSLQNKLGLKYCLNWQKSGGWRSVWPYKTRFWPNLKNPWANHEDSHITWCSEESKRLTHSALVCFCYQCVSPSALILCVTGTVSTVLMT